jgi:hypothetical protein
MFRTWRCSIIVVVIIIVTVASGSLASSGWAGPHGAHLR